MPQARVRQCQVSARILAMAIFECAAQNDCGFQRGVVVIRGRLAGVEPHQFALAFAALGKMDPGQAFSPWNRRKLSTGKLKRFGDPAVLQGYLNAALVTDFRARCTPDFGGLTRAF